MRAPLHKRTKEVEVRIDYAFNQEKALVGAFSVITNPRIEHLKH